MSSAMLPSLRPLIAEILVPHRPPTSADPGAWLGNLFGAETLYWCDEHELKGMASRAEMVEELEDMRQQLAEIAAELDEGSQGLLGRIREILET